MQINNITTKYKQYQLVKFSNLMSQFDQIVIDKSMVKNAIPTITNFNPLFSLNAAHIWDSVLPISCKTTPLYFTPLYPWTYRMSAKVSNYTFGKDPNNNRLTFNMNLSVKHELRGVYFFSNYDTTNYGKLEAKKRSLYRLYPSLNSISVAQSNDYIYKHPVTNNNLAYLPLPKYFSNTFINDLIKKVSGNPWFTDSLAHSFLRRYHNIHAHNVMSKDIDSVISMFDTKLMPIFEPINTSYNLQRIFSLGLSPDSKAKVFIPHKYFRSTQAFYRRFNFWSKKYSDFWYNLQTLCTLNYAKIIQLFIESTQQLKSIMLNGNYTNIINKLQSNVNDLKSKYLSYLDLLKKKNNVVHSSISPFIYTFSQRVDNLYNKLFKSMIKNNNLSINIDKGTSSLTNLVFSTRNIAVTNIRTLYHYYPFYTKKPYGTGIKYILNRKSAKFNKTKTSILSQILKLNYMPFYTASSFNRIQQLSKWIPYNIYKHAVSSNKRYLLNVLSLPKNKNYSPLLSEFLGEVSDKSIYQHLLPSSNKLNKYFNNLQLHIYLLYSQYNKKLYKKFNKNSKWYRNHKNPQQYVDYNPRDFIAYYFNLCLDILNIYVKNYVLFKYNILAQSILPLINHLKNIGGYNWLKYFLMPYDISYVTYILNIKDYGDNDDLINHHLLINGIDQWLKNNAKFYCAYDLLTSIVDKLNLSAQLEMGVDQSNLQPIYQNFIVPTVPNHMIWADKKISLKSPLCNFQTLNIKKSSEYLMNWYNKTLSYKTGFKNTKKLIYLDYHKNSNSYQHALPYFKTIEYKSLQQIFINQQKAEAQALLELKKLQKIRFAKEKKIQQMALAKEYREKKRQQKKLAREQKLEEERLAREQELEKERVIKEQERQQEKLAREQKKEEQRIFYEKRTAKRKIVQVGLGEKLPTAVWRSLDDDQRTHYHAHQKRLRTAIKKGALSNENNSLDNSNNYKKPG